VIFIMLFFRSHLISPRKYRESGRALKVGIVAKLFEESIVLYFYIDNRIKLLEHHIFGLQK